MRFYLLAFVFGCKEHIRAPFLGWIRPAQEHTGCRLDFFCSYLQFHGPLPCWPQKCVSGLGSSRKMGFGTRSFSPKCFMTLFTGPSHSIHFFFHHFRAFSSQPVHAGGRRLPWFSRLRQSWAGSRGGAGVFSQRPRPAVRWGEVSICGLS